MIERKNTKSKQVKNKQKQRPFIGFSRGLLSLSLSRSLMNETEIVLLTHMIVGYLPRVLLKNLWFVCRLTFDICWRCCSCVTGKQSVIRVCVWVFGFYRVLRVSFTFACVNKTKRTTNKVRVGAFVHITFYIVLLLLL